MQSELRILLSFWSNLTKSVKWLTLVVREDTNVKPCIIDGWKTSLSLKKITIDFACLGIKKKEEKETNFSETIMCLTSTNICKRGSWCP